MSFIFQSNASYMMPAHFGTPQDLKIGRYLDQTSYTISYITDKDAVAALLPEPFEPTDEPGVSITCTVCRGVSFLAGGGYNLIAVNLSVVFHGKKNHVTGGFAAILWENDTYPIILGRELLGAPKLYAEIPAPWITDNALSFYCSEYGTKLLDAEIKNPTPADEKTVQQMQQQAGSGHWFCWRYLPNLNQQGAEVSYATDVRSRPTIKQVWLGEGSHRFYETTFQKTPVSNCIMKGLNTLKVKEYRPAVVVKGSNDLLIAETRKLE